MLEKLIFGGILIAHINSYKKYIADIITTFAITFILKKILKGSGEPTKADLVGLGGYCITGSEFFEYIGAVLSSGNTSIDNKVIEDTVKGLIPSIVDGVKEALKK